MPNRRLLRQDYSTVECQGSPISDMVEGDSMQSSALELRSRLQNRDARAQDDISFEMFTPIREALAMNRPYEVPTLIVRDMTFSGMDPAELAKIPNVGAYEDRLACTIYELGKDPNLSVVLLTTEEIDSAIIEYRIFLLARAYGVDPESISSRLQLLTASSDEATHAEHPGQPLAAIRQNHEAMSCISETIRDGDFEQYFVDSWNPNSDALALATSIGVPYANVKPETADFYGSKTGSREIFKEAGVQVSPGAERINSLGRLYEVFHELITDPKIRRIMMKLNISFSGEGNSPVSTDRMRNITLVDPGANEYFEFYMTLVHAMELPPGGITKELFLAKLFEGYGGIVEAYVEDKIASPSVKAVIPAQGEPLLYTNEQMVEGDEGIYVGSSHPANPAYAPLLMAEARKILSVLQSKGIIGELSLDAVITEPNPGEYDIYFLEINLRRTGTTPPFETVYNLVPGATVNEEGQLQNADGELLYYTNSDNIIHEFTTNRNPQFVIDLIRFAGLEYNPETQEGVVLHLLEGTQVADPETQQGKFGVTCIGKSEATAQELFDQVKKIVAHPAVQRVFLGQQEGKGHDTDVYWVDVELPLRSPIFPIQTESPSIPGIEAVIRSRLAQQLPIDADPTEGPSLFIQDIDLDSNTIRATCAGISEIEVRSLLGELSREVNPALTAPVPDVPMLSYVPLGGHMIEQREPTRYEAAGF